MTDLPTFLEQRWQEAGADALEYAKYVAMTHEPRRLIDRGLGDGLQIAAAKVSPAHVLADIASKRAVLEWHKSWPVLVEQPPTFDRVDATDPNSMTFRASQQIAWLTEREYRTRFGSEPPTASILKLLAAPYADHPDYDPARSLS